MTGYLLDTSVVLWAMAEPNRLSAAARAAIEEGPTVLSVLSYWEVVLKSAKGKLDVGNPRIWWETALGDLGATSLPFRPRHVSEIADLPGIHADPFDRALVAQAIAEGLTLVTMDRAITGYASTGLRVMG